MDTPRTNQGDATYLGRQPPDFDMTQEPSFQLPSKDNNLLQQLRNGRGASLRTPRGSRAPLGDRRNLLAGIGGSEFTPMLKSATRNSARRRGKENTNGLATPALGKIDEDMDMTNVPVESSLYGPSRNMSYVDATPLPEVDASSTTSTPLVLPTRRGGNKGPLQDGNQLSLREQENVIDKIEKENFGLKLKIHFLEEALRKTGPGFSEAALKENTELKVDKVTMQRELSKYKKQLASAENDLETYQQQILSVQERAKKKYADQNQKAENDALRRRLEDKEAEISKLERQIKRQSQDDNDQVGQLNDEISQLRDEIGDLEADLREKDREVSEYEDKMDELKTKSEKFEEKWKTAQAEIEQLQLLQLQHQSNDNGQISELHKRISDLETSLRTKNREVNEREAEIGALQQQLEERPQNEGYVNQLHARVDELEASLRAKDKVSQEREDRIGELNTKLEGMEKKYKTAEAEIGNLQQQTQRQLQRQSQGDGQVNQLQKEIDNLNVSLRAKDREANERRDELDEWRTKFEEVEADLRAKDEEAFERQDERDELTSKLQEMEQRWKTAQAKIQALQQQLQSQNDSQIHQLRNKISDLEADLLAKDQEADERESEIDELNRELERVDATVSSKDREIKEREDEMKGLKAKLEKAEGKCKTAEGRVAELENGPSREDLAEAKETIKVLEGNIRRLQQQLDDRKDKLQQAIDAEGSLSVKEKKLRDTLNSETERHKSEETVLNRQIDALKRDLEARQSALTSLRDTLNSETERHQGEETMLNRQIDALRRDLEARQSAFTSLRETLNSETERHKNEEAVLGHQMDELRRNLNTQESNGLNSETERHKNEEAALSRQIDDLKRDLDARQSTLVSLRSEISDLRDDLAQAELDCQEQAEKIEALEDEVEVLQATLDEESEDANQRLRQADALCRDLKRQLELSKQEQVSRVDRLGQSEDADKVAEDLGRQLEETKQKLQDTEEECRDLKRKVDNASRQQSREATQANQATEDLKRQLARSQRESKKTKLLCEDLRSQLDTAKQELDYANPLCKELRQKLDRARSERAAYQASAEKLQIDCERLKKGAQEALAWIQAKNAEKSSSLAPGPIKKAAMATFRYGDVVMDVVDQKDHEAVIRAADSAQRRHEKEIRGMAMQMEWMQARWERESKLRNDGAFAKKFLQLRLDIADACNKADLRILNRIHQDLGLKSPSELLSKRQKSRKPLNMLKVFVGVIRAVARMRVAARKWGEHEKTRLRLVAAWEEQKQKQVVC